MHFGTVARYRVKPGHLEQLLDEMRSFESAPPAGWIYTTLFQSASDPDEVWMSTAFEDEQRYRENADSAAMDERYRGLLEHLQGEPEWHDGQVVHEGMRQG